MNELVELQLIVKVINMESWVQDYFNTKGFPLLYPKGRSNLLIKYVNELRVAVDETKKLYHLSSVEFRMFIVKKDRRKIPKAG